MKLDVASRCLIAVAMVAVSTARAQPAADVVREFQDGTDAFRLGDYPGARAHLERAAALDASLPGPWRFLAAVDAAEHQWQPCVDHARTAIIANPASSEIVATRKLHDDCRAALDRPSFIGDYNDGGALAISTNIAGAAITIGGLKAGASPLAPRVIGLGPVEVIARKPGWRTTRVTVTVIPGVVTDAVLDLVEAPGALDVPIDTTPPHVGWLVVTAPDSATITVDGAVVEPDDRGRYQLPFGEHTVDVVAPGAVRFHRRVRIDLGQVQTVVATLPLASARDRRRRIGVIALGTAVGFGAVGAVAGLWSMRTADHARDWAAIERARSPVVPLSESGAVAPVHTRADISAESDRARHLSIVSGVSYVASAAALSIGVYLLVRNPDERTVQLAPMIGESWGLAVEGAWR
jgi:PEGA domain